MDGTWFRMERGVKRRQKADSQTFQAAKQAVFDDLHVWAACVEAAESHIPE